MGGGAGASNFQTKGQKFASTALTGSFAFAISVLDSNAVAHVKPDAILTVGDDLFVQSDTIDRNNTSAGVTTKPNQGGTVTSRLFAWGLGAAGIKGTGIPSTDKQQLALQNKSAYGVAVAVSVETGNTDAWMDGTAIVGGSILVNAKQNNGNVNGFDLNQLFTSMSGVSAATNVGSARSNFALSLQKSLVEYYDNNKRGGVAEDRTSFQAGFSVAVMVDTNDVEARIGDGVIHTTQPYAVANDDISVTATVNARPDITASSKLYGRKTDLVIDDSSKVKDKDKKYYWKDATAKRKDKQVDTGIAVAVAVGNYDNTANAWISSYAIVDAAGDLLVQGRAVNEIDPMSLFGVNLIAPLLDENLKPDYDTNSGKKKLLAGDTVIVRDSHTAGGTAGKTYLYQGPDNKEVDLGLEDFTTVDWNTVDLTLQAGLNFMRTFGSYADGNFGLDNNLIDSLSQVQANGFKKNAFAVAVAVVSVHETANALIKSDAKINQDATRQAGFAPLPTFSQNVTVTADSVNQAVNVGGGFVTNGISLFRPVQESINKNTKGKLAEKLIGVNPYEEYPVEGKESGAARAIGLSFQFFTYESDVIANIEEGVILKAETLKVDAQSRVLAVTVGLAKGAGGNFGLVGTLVYNAIDNHTTASIDGRARISVDGNVLVVANDDSYLITVAGSMMSSEKIGVAGSVALNDVQRNTQAFIGRGITTTAPLAAGGFVNAGGKIDVLATNDGFMGVFAVPGAEAAKLEKKSAQAEKTKTAFALAVGYSQNFLTDTTRTYIQDGVVTANGNVQLNATNTTIAEAFALGGAYARGSSNSIAIAGAVAINDLGNTTESFIRNSRGTAPDVVGVRSTTGTIKVLADDAVSSHSQAGAVALSITQSSTPGSSSGGTGANNQDSSTKLTVSVGVSIALNLVGQTGANTIRAYIENATGGVPLNDDPIPSPNTIRAYIENATVRSQGDLELIAKSTGKITATALSGSVAVQNASENDQLAGGTSLSGAASGAFASNLIESTIVSSILSGSVVTSQAGLVTLRAKDETDFIRSDAFGGALAYSAANKPNSKSGSLAIGIGLSRNKLENTIQSTIDTSTVEGFSGVSLDATSDVYVSSLAIGVSASVARSTGGGSGLTIGIAAAGSAALNEIDNHITSAIRGSSGQHFVNSSNGSVVLNSLDKDEVIGVAGTVAFALGLNSSQTASGGATAAVAVGVTVVKNDKGTDGGHSVISAIENFRVRAKNDIVVQAKSLASILSIGVGGSVSAASGGNSSGLTGALAGAGVGVDNHVEQTVASRITGSSVVRSTQGKVHILATDSSTVAADAGALSLAIAVGKGTGSAASGSIGLAIALNTIETNVWAYVDASSVTAKSIEIAARSIQDPSSSSDDRVQALAIGIAGAGSKSSKTGLAGAFAGAGAGTRNCIDNSILAYVNNSSGTQGLDATSGGIDVIASDDSSINADAGGVAIAATLGGTSAAGTLGVSVALNEIGTGRGHHVESYVDKSRLTSTGPILISSLSTAEIDALALAGSLSIAASSGTGLSGALAGAGVGTSNSIEMTIQSSVRNQSTLTANNGLLNPPGGTPTASDITIVAMDQSSIKSQAIAGSVAVGASTKSSSLAIAIGVSVAVNEVSNRIVAEVDDSIVTTPKGKITVSAQSSADIDAVAVAASVSVAAAKQTGVAVSGGGALTINTINSTTDAQVTDSRLTATLGQILVSASSDSSIESQVVATALGIGVGSNAGGAAAIGVSIAKNIIGDNSSSSTPSARVQALLKDSILVAGGNVSVTATSNQRVDSIVVAVSAAIAAGKNAVGLSGAGVYTENRIRQAILAQIDGDGMGVGSGIEASSIHVEATDISVISATAGAAAVSAAIGTNTVGVAASIGLSLAHNRIDNQIEASISHVDALRLAQGDILVAANNNAAVDAISFAASIAAGVSGKAGVAVSGGGAESTNVILTKTNAFIANSEIGSLANRVGNVSVRSRSNSDIDAVIGAVGIAVGVGSSSAGVGVALGVAVARNFIGWDPTGASVSGTIVDADDVPRSQIETGTRVRILDGALAGEVYEYIGPTLRDSDPNQSGNQQFDLRNQQYRDSTAWKHISLGSSPAELQAFISNSSIQSSKDLVVDALSTQTIDAVVVAAAVGVGVGSTAGVGVSAAGSYGENKIQTYIKSFIDGDGANSATDGIGAANVSLSALDSSAINSVAGAASLSAAFGSTAGVAVGVGLSLAFNEVDNAVFASIVNADQGVTTSTGSVSISAASTSSKLFDIPFGGSLTASTLDDAAEAAQDDSDTGKLNEATQDLLSDITVLESLRSAFASQGFTLATFDIVGTASMYNTDDEETQDLREGTTVRIASGFPTVRGDTNRVYRYIGSDRNQVNLNNENYLDTTNPNWVRLEKLKLSTLVEGQSWALTAPDGASFLLERSGNSFSVTRNTINSVSAAAALSAGFGSTAGVAVAGAGAVAQNVVLSRVNAFIADSVITTQTDVDLSAESRSKIFSTVVAASLAVGGGSTAGVGASIGIAIARNMVGWKPFALQETPAQVRTYIVDSQLNVSGNLTQSATSNQSIQSILVAGSVAVGLGGTAGVGVAGSGAIAENKVGVDVEAYIDGATGSGILADRITLTARDQSKIDAITAAASLSVALGGTAGVAVSVGVSTARNVISSDVASYIKDVGSKVQSTIGNIALLADSQSRIQSVSAAASIAAGFGGVAGVAVAGAGAVSTNVILTHTEAFLDNSTLQSVGVLTVEAKNTASIQSLVVAASGSIAIGGTVGVGASIGAATASNLIGKDELGFQAGSTVQAYSKNANILGATGLTIQALNDQEIKSLVVAGSVAIAGGTVGVGVAGAGAISSNDISVDVLAYIDGDGAQGISVGSLTVKADDDSYIKAETGAASVAASFGVAGASVAVGLASAINNINNTIDAAIRRADQVTTTSGAVMVLATERAIIESTTASAAAAASVSIGGSAAGALTTSQNNLRTRTNASILSSIVNSAGGVTIEAIDSSNVSADVVSVALSAGLVSLAVGVVLVDNSIGNDVNAFIDSSTVTANGSGDVYVHASSQPTIDAESIVGAVSFGLGGSGAGGSSKVGIRGTTQAYIVGSNVTAASDDIRVLAESQAIANPKIKSLSAGLAAVNAMVSEATFSGQTKAWLGGSVTLVANSTQVRAVNTSQAKPDTVLAGGGAISFSLATSKVTLAQPTNAYVASGARVQLNAGSLDVLAESSGTAYTNSSSASVGGIAVSVLDILSTTNNTTGTKIDNGASIFVPTTNTTGDITLSATSKNFAVSNTSSNGGGGINIQVSNSKAVDSSTTESLMLGNITGPNGGTSGARNLTVRATANDRALAGAQTAGGGLIQVGVAESNAQVSPTVNASLGGNVQVTNTILVVADSRTDADSSNDSAVGGGVSVSVLNANVTVSPTIQTMVQPRARIVAGNTVAIHAIHGETAPQSPLLVGGTAPPAADGVATSSAGGASGGAVQVSSIASSLSLNPKVTAVIDQGAKLFAIRAIDVRSTSMGKADVSATGVGGGIISVGSSNSTLNLHPVGAVRVASDASLLSPGNDSGIVGSITIVSATRIDAKANAASTGGGLVALAAADIAANISYTSNVDIGSSAIVQTNGLLSVTSSSETDATVTSDVTAGGGVAVGSITTNLNVGSTGTPATTNTSIGTNALLRGRQVDVKALVGKLNLINTAEESADGVGSGATANALTVVYNRADVVLGSNSAVTGENVTIESNIAPVSIVSTANATAYAVVGIPNAEAKGDYNSVSEVYAASGALVSGATVAVNAKQNIATYERNAREYAWQNGSSGDAGSETGHLGAVRRIDWNGDIAITSAPNPKLFVDSTGKIVEAIGVTVAGLGAGSVISVGTVSVDPILNNTSSANAITFTTSPSQLKDGETSPQGVITGTGGTVSVASAFQTVSIVNNSNKDLSVNFLNPGENQDSSKALVSTVTKIGLVDHRLNALEESLSNLNIVTAEDFLQESVKADFAEWVIFTVKSDTTTEQVKSIHIYIFIVKIL